MSRQHPRQSGASCVALLSAGLVFAWASSGWAGEARFGALGDAIARSETWPGPRFAEQSPLTKMEVLARLRQGKPNKVIAYELDISESTAKTFVRRILIKLRAVNRTEVAHLTEGQFDAIRAAWNARRSRPVVV